MRFLRRTPPEREFDRTERTESPGRSAIPATPQQVEVSGRVPASRAAAVADAAIVPLDPDRWLTSIVSDTNIDGAGLARGWELFYDLPNRGTQLIARLAPCPGSADPDDGPLCLTLRETPIFAGIPDENRQFMAGVAKGFGMTIEELERRTREQALTERQPALPEPFIDSPAAVAALAAKGVDFISGPTDLVLSTKRLKNGSVVWAVQDRKREYTTAFAG